jgi:proline iminopeptidase
LKIERIDLLGPSGAGIFSMPYAIRYPQHVAHLIPVGSGASKPAEHEFLFDKPYPEIVAAIPDDPSRAGPMCVRPDCGVAMFMVGGGRCWLSLPA